MIGKMSNNSKKRKETAKRPNRHHNKPQKPAPSDPHKSREHFRLGVRGKAIAYRARTVRTPRRRVGRCGTRDAGRFTGPASSPPSAGAITGAGNSRGAAFGGRAQSGTHDRLASDPPKRTMTV